MVRVWTLLSEQKLQWNLVLVNDIFKSKGSVANCMTGRASVHTRNASEQFLHRNRTLILVHTVPEQLLKRSKNLYGTAVWKQSSHLVPLSIINTTEEQSSKVTYGNSAVLTRNRLISHSILHFINNINWKWEPVLASRKDNMGLLASKSFHLYL